MIFPFWVRDSTMIKIDPSHTYIYVHSLRNMFAERVYQSGKTRRRNALRARNLKRDKELLKSQTLQAPDVLKRHKQEFKSETLPAQDKTPQQQSLPDTDMTFPQSEGPILELPDADMKGPTPECTIECIRIQDYSFAYAGRTYW